MLARAVALILLVVFTMTQVTQPDVIDGEVEFKDNAGKASGKKI